MDVSAFRTPSLGDSTYLVSHRGIGILIDPQRDYHRFREAATSAGTAITHVFETHLHNDYVSGGHSAASALGADLVLPAGAGVSFPHVAAFHREEVAVGQGLSVRPLHTPGHTPEHCSYLVLIDEEPQVVFSGGSLLVGSAGRTDLLGAHLARQLARLQFGSIRRLAELPPDVGLYPTHGAGSFCSVSAPGADNSTIGQELATNPALAYTTAEEFADGQLSALVPYPSYYRRMAPINRAGPGPLPVETIVELDPERFDRLRSTATVVDGRDREAFAAGHVPGALSIELAESFAPWVGWLADFDRPIVLVLDDRQDADLATVELGRIGFDRVEGVLRGVAGWAATGRTLEALRTASAAALRAELETGAPQVVDVRDPAEWREAHHPGTIHCYVPDLEERAKDLLDPGREVWVVCRSGHRASIGASILARLGLEPVVVIEGGVPDLL